MMKRVTGTATTLFAARQFSVNPMQDQMAYLKPILLSNAAKAAENRKRLWPLLGEWRKAEEMAKKDQIDLNFELATLELGCTDNQPRAVCPQTHLLTIPGKYRSILMKMISHNVEYQNSAHRFGHSPYYFHSLLETFPSKDRLEVITGWSDSILHIIVRNHEPAKHEELIKILSLILNALPEADRPKAISIRDRDDSSVFESMPKIVQKNLLEKFPEMNLLGCEDGAQCCFE
jgi:hypothetical protein